MPEVILYHQCSRCGLGLPRDRSAICPVCGGSEAPGMSQHGHPPRTTPERLRTTREAITERSCEQCGKPIEVEVSSEGTERVRGYPHSFCSRACRARAWRQRKRIAPPGEASAKLEPKTLVPREQSRNGHGAFDALSFYAAPSDARPGSLGRSEAHLFAPRAEHRKSE